MVSIRLLPDSSAHVCVCLCVCVFYSETSFPAPPYSFSTDVMWSSDDSDWILCLDRDPQGLEENEDPVETKEGL